MDMNDIKTDPAQSSVLQSSPLPSSAPKAPASGIQKQQRDKITALVKQNQILRTKLDKYDHTVETLSDKCSTLKAQQTQQAQRILTLEDELKCSQKAAEEAVKERDIEYQRLRTLAEVLLTMETKHAKHVETLENRNMTSNKAMRAFIESSRDRTELRIANLREGFKHVEKVMNEIKSTFD